MAEYVVVACNAVGFVALLDELCDVVLPRQSHVTVPAAEMLNVPVLLLRLCVRTVKNQLKNKSHMSYWVYTVKNQL